MRKEPKCYSYLIKKKDEFKTFCKTGCLLIYNAILVFQCKNTAAQAVKMFEEHSWEEFDCQLDFDYYQLTSILPDHLPLASKLLYHNLH